MELLKLIGIIIFNLIKKGQGQIYSMHMRNHVKTRGLSKGYHTVWWMLAMGLADLWGLQICIAERSKVPNG